MEEELDNKYDHLMKVVFVGDVGVGKTSLISRYCWADSDLDPFVLSATYAPTIGLDFRTKMIETQDKRVKLQIWDTVRRKKQFYLFRKINELNSQLTCVMQLSQEI